MPQLLQNPCLLKVALNDNAFSKNSHNWKLCSEALFVCALNLLSSVFVCHPAMFFHTLDFLLFLTCVLEESCLLTDPIWQCFLMPWILDCVNKHNILLVAEFMCIQGATSRCTLTFTYFIIFPTISKQFVVFRYFHTVSMFWSHEHSLLLQCSSAGGFMQGIKPDCVYINVMGCVFLNTVPRIFLPKAMPAGKLFCCWRNLAFGR